MKNIEEEIKSYFDQKEIPPINEERVKELQTETLQNKRKKSFWYSFKKYGIATICLLLVLVSAILIPIFTQKQEKFYADNENTNKRELTLEYTKNYIDENYSKYSFVFEDYNIFKTIGVYTKDTNTLLAIRMEGEKIDIPFTSLNFCLAINKNFIPIEKGTYMELSQKEQKEDYTLYSKEITNLSDTIIYRVLDFKNYTLYVKVNYTDYDAIEKFL